MKQGDMPVIFLPNDEDQNEVDENCEDTGDAQMSSFGLMSFAMAMVNAVINNANNVNNNNNNNNNNDNNNNNNLGNINVANSNNDVNNMNMVTAGRRRMLDKKEQRNNIKGVRYTPVTENPIEEKKPSLEEAQQNPYVHSISIGYLTKNHTDKATNNDIKVVPNIASKTRQNAIKIPRMEEGYSLKRIHEAFSMITDKIFKRIVYYLDKSLLKKMFNNFAYHFYSR